MPSTSARALFFSLCLCAALPATAATDTVLHSFGAPGDGLLPSGQIASARGLLFGTTLLGGTGGCTGNCGVVYSLAADGTEKVVYSFTGRGDGGEPGGLVNVHGTLYGTTGQGGNPGCYGNRGCGTIYSITPSGAFHVVYSFKGGAGDAGLPIGPLVELNGTLYGATFDGGPADAGTVYAIAPDGTERVVYAFTGGRDGAVPTGGLLADQGVLYGLAAWGGDSKCQVTAGRPGCGVVYSLTPDGTQTVLHRFKAGGDAENPYFVSLTKVGHRFYGVTSAGGSQGMGAIFSISKSGRERVAYSFKGTSDGAQPATTLVRSGSLLYGVAVAGGAAGHGTAFSLDPRTGAESTIYSFTGGATDAAGPNGSLIISGGNLYGVSFYGGSYGEGTYFKLAP